MQQQYGDSKPGEEATEDMITRVKEKIKVEEKKVLLLEQTRSFNASNPTALAKTEEEIKVQNKVVQSLKAELAILQQHVNSSSSPPPPPPSKTSNSTWKQNGEWIEYKTDDNVAYYYNSKTGETVWENPNKN